MKVVASTDGKYLAKEVTEPLVGETVNLDDFQLLVAYKFTTTDGDVAIGNANYQLILKD